MSRSKLVEHAYDCFNRYYGDYHNLRNQDIKDAVHNVVHRYRTNLGEGLNAYGKLIDKYTEFFKQSPNAFKKLIKYACYLDNNPDAPDFAEKLGVLVSMSEDFKQVKFNHLLEKYDAIFSIKDWEDARSFFKEHPDEVYAGSRDDLMYSYIKSGDQITRRSSNLGFGSFGRTRVGDTEQEDSAPLAIKRQINKSHATLSEDEKIRFASRLVVAKKDELRRQVAAGNGSLPEVKSFEATLNKFSDVSTEYEQIIDELYWLPQVQKEANFNYDLQVATTDLIVRRNPDGSIYKVYQEMYDFGPNLDTYLQNYNPSNEERLELAIKLLLLGDDLHTGKLSRTQTPYAHRDIKEQNILVDANRDLHFIDFGFSKNHDLDVAHISHSGTLGYLPISFNPHYKIEALRDIENGIVEETPSYLFDDKVAILRTIYHEAYGTGILGKDLFDSLPQHIWEMICSHDIDYLKNVDHINSCKFIAVVLIAYAIQPEFCTYEYIVNLENNPDLQDDLINSYLQTRRKIRGQDLASIKNLLLAKEINFEQLPYALRIRSAMDPSYLQFLLENNLLPAVDMYNLTVRLNIILARNGFDESLIKTVLKNKDFFDYYLRQATENDLNIFFDTLNKSNLLSAEELGDLHVEALALSIDVPAINDVADIDTIFYKLIEKALLYNSVDDVYTLEHYCDLMAYNGEQIAFRPEDAAQILQNANIFKLITPETRKSQELLIDKFIDNFKHASEICEEALKSCPTDKNTQEYANIKVFFAAIVRLHITANQLEEGLLDEQGFIDKVNMLAAFYQDQFLDNEALKTIFYPKDTKARKSPVSVTDMGIFSSSKDSSSDIEPQEDENDSPKI